jgi:WD40 repeat protein
LSNSKRLFTANAGTRIVAWDVATGHSTTVCEAPSLFAYTPQALALSPDDKTLAILSIDNSIHLWDVSDSKLRDVPDNLKRRTEQVRGGGKLPVEPGVKPRVVLRGHGSYVTAIAFHPDGKILASASIDGTIKLWDVVTGEVRLTLEGHTANITTIAFTPDRNTLISTDQDGTVKVWHAAPVDKKGGAVK